MVQHNRRAGWSYEVLLLIFLNLAAWASSAGMLWQSVRDIDRRTTRIENNLDILLTREKADHGETR
jgi:hypothetical protein